MSSQMQERSIDWCSVWEEYGKEPHDPLTNAKLPIAVASTVDCDVDAEQLILRGIEAGELEHADGGIKVAGETPPEQELEFVEEEPDPVDPAPEEMDRGDLVETVQELQKENEEQSNTIIAMDERLTKLTNAVFGVNNLNSAFDTEEMTDVWTRVNNLSEDVADHENEFQLFSGQAKQYDEPDDRARRLRRVLYENARANSNGKATMDRDSANNALGGGLNRYTVLDAMKRAADGEDADIDGTSSLENFGGIEMVVGKGRGKQSRIRMNLEDATGDQLRRIPTTGKDSKGVN